MNLATFGLYLIPILQLHDTGTARFIINDKDMPQGLCNLGDLVRKVKSHIEAEHPDALPPHPEVVIGATTTRIVSFNPWTGYDGCKPDAVYINSNPPTMTVTERRRLADCYQRSADKQERDLKEAEAARAAKLAAITTLLDIVTECSGSEK